MLYGCTRCKRELESSAFSPSQLKLKGRWCKECQNESRRNKRQGVSPKRITDTCLTCGKDIRHMRAHAKWCSSSCTMKGYRALNPGRQREYWIKSVYGLTATEFDTLLGTQGGVCAICGTVPTAMWNVDHDHSTGRVRGLLCPACNSGLGYFRDDPGRLRSAIRYLGHSIALAQGIG